MDKDLAIYKNYVQWYQKGQFEAKSRAYFLDSVAPTIIRESEMMVCNKTKEGFMKDYKGIYRCNYTDEFLGDRKRFVENAEVSGTICTHNNEGVVSGLEIRKITPREAWRLQGQSIYQDGKWIDETFEKAQSVCSDTQLLKQAGNSITVNVMEKLLGELFRQYPYE